MNTKVGELQSIDAGGKKYNHKQRKIKGEIKYRDSRKLGGISGGGGGGEIGGRILPQVYFCEDFFLFCASFFAWNLCLS